jgi:hypothetical protein
VTKLALIVRSICAVLALTTVAAAEDRGPEMNPYECLGRYEAATGNRSMTQVRAELEKKLHPLFEPGEPPTIKAMKACVVAMLESRLGDDDAPTHYALAIEQDPEEPGYEYWFGHYWNGFRGARGPIVERAEDHYYRALEKLEAKKKAGKYRDYHAVVEEWTRKQLLVSYQEDGLHLGGKNSVSVSAQFALNKDTRDFFRNNEMRLFTGELMFAESRARALGLLKAPQLYEIARAPLRHREEARLRLRLNALGAFDVSAAYERCGSVCQITSYYLPPGAPAAATGAVGTYNDVNLREIGGNYERVFPLYPLFDFKLRAGAKYIDRQGVVEFLPDIHEKFMLYEGHTSFSHFVGPDKIDLDLTYVFMNVPDIKFGVPSEAQRGKYIRAANLEYAIYRPFVLPEVRNGVLGVHRTPTRGWYWNLGAADDDDVYGLKTVRKHDFYLATRFEGAGNWDYSLQGTYSTSKITSLDPNTGLASSDLFTPMESTSFRTTAIIQRRIINPDAIPGISGSVIDADMINLVVPISWDKGLSGTPCYNDAGAYPTNYTSAADCYKTYENFRAGVEIWSKFFGVGHAGPALLTTIGYDYQYFYNIKKAVNAVHLNLRMGWDWHRL